MDTGDKTHTRAHAPKRTNALRQPCDGNKAQGSLTKLGQSATYCFVHRVRRTMGGLYFLNNNGGAWNLPGPVLLNVKCLEGGRQQEAESKRGDIKAGEACVTRPPGLSRLPLADPSTSC